MTMTPSEIGALSAAIAASASAELLGFVARRQGVVSDFDNLRKINGELSALAEAVVRAYDEKGAVRRLVETLVRELYWSPSFLDAAAPFYADTADAREAFHRRRDHVMASRALSRFCLELEPRICFIVGKYKKNGAVRPTSGTGFLVAPDLILTAAHVVEPLLDAAGAQIPESRVAAFFDYRDEPTVKDVDQRPNHCLRVDFASQKWLVAKGASLAGDGLDDPQGDPTLRAALAAHLDYALVRLAEPVGNGAVWDGGGSRRGWFVLPDAAAIPILGSDSRIIIVQHPAGEPRQIDFGRYLDGCEGRFWYDTETAPGASGAPCVASDLSLIGVHNAELRPRRWNQGVPLAAFRSGIERHIAKAIDDAKTPAPAHLWNLAPSESTPRVVLGRLVFLEWLERARAASLGERRDRIYAGVAQDDAGSGRRFSLEILRKFVGPSSDHRLLVFGGEGSGGELPPTRVEDMVKVLARHFGVPPADLDDMPARPTADLPATATDGDKMRRWASESVPRWFTALLEKSRPKRIDRRASAIAEKLRLEAASRIVPPYLRAEADSAEPIYIEVGWSVGWIAFDRVNSAVLTPEISAFIGGLSGSTRSESDTPEILRRLRWLFLGYRPDLFAKGEVTVEDLRSDAITGTDTDLLLTSAWSSRGLVVTAEKLDLFKAVVRRALSSYDATTPARARLAFLQSFVSGLIATFLPQNENEGGSGP